MRAEHGIAFALYYKRVMRKVRRHTQDTHIDNRIQRELWEKVTSVTGDDPTEAQVRSALQQMGKPSDWGIYYRNLFSESGRRFDGFLLFEGFFTGIAPMALMLIVVFAVFRLFPQREYVAYGLVALGAIASAWHAHHNFLSMGYLAATVLIPSVLLLYYPVRDALVLDGSSFISNLICYENRVILVSVLLLNALFILTICFFHALDYTYRPWRTAIASLSVVLCALLTAGLVFYGLNLKKDYDSQAAVLLSDLRTTYNTYLENGTADGMIARSEEIDALLAKYIDIFVAEPRQTAGSFTECLQFFLLHDASPAHAITKYHPAFTPENVPGRDTQWKVFDYSALDREVSSLKFALAQLLGNTDSSTLGAVSKLEQQVYPLRVAFLQKLDNLYTDWFYS